MGSYKDILEKRKKDWGYSGLMDGANAERGGKIPFSSPLMNWCTYGGVPRDKLTEFYGEPGSGKSTSCIDICKNSISLFNEDYEKELERLRQLTSEGNKSARSELEDLQERGPKKVLYIDLEHSFDAKWSSTLGINPEEIDIMQPPDVPAEEILQTITEIIESNEVGLLVLDSVPTLVPRTEIEKKLGERTVAALAGLMTVFCRKVVPLLTRYNCTLIVINQIRDNMDNPYVVKTPGGKALKFYASLRIYFKNGKPVDFLGNELPQSAENPAGYIVNAKITKQKTAPFDRKDGSYYLMCSNGIRPDIDIAQLAVKKYGIIKKSGAWFTVCDPSTGEIMEDESGKLVKLNGMGKVLEYLQSNPDYYNSVKQYIVNDIEGKDAEFDNATETE